MIGSKSKEGGNLGLGVVERNTGAAGLVGEGAAGRKYEGEGEGEGEGKYEGDGEGEVVE